MYEYMPESVHTLCHLDTINNLSFFLVLQNNIDQCPECGHLKLKHVLCGFCYEKVKHETHLIRQEIKAKEGGPFSSPTVETVVLYDGEKPRPEDEAKRIIERKQKRPLWFSNQFYA